MQGKLDEHLRDADMRASEMYDRLVEQLKGNLGITEQFKADDMMAWVQAMNNISNRVREVVWNDIINITLQ